MGEPQHVFIVGSKGIPAAYGGYETFVDKLTECHQGLSTIKYHVACKANGTGVSPEAASLPDVFDYHGAECFKVPVPNIGPAQAIAYDCRAIEACLRRIEEQGIPHPIVYVLACRIGPWTGRYARRLHELGGRLYVNPDGHEWMRAKWSRPVRRYWKESERLMTKHADLMVCDSRNIERYIRLEYAAYRPATTYIAYGAETTPSALADDDPGLAAWYAEHGLAPHEYYLMVGRFVPENNFQTVIREFMASHTRRKLAMVTTDDPRFLERLDDELHFSQDSRIVFAGTVYDGELLKKIRENAYAYLHGHEVGGTNPSLLEALALTKLNLLLDVGFNREVGEDAALYWTKLPGNLAAVIDNAEHLTPREVDALGARARARIECAYSWRHIADEYERLFLRADADTGKRIRIGIDGHMIGDRSGGNESYYRNILESIDVPPEWDVYLFIKKGTPIEPFMEKFKVVRYETDNAAIRNFIEVPRLCRKLDLDLLHMQYFIPFVRPCPVMTTIHDLSFEHYGDIFTKRELMLQKTLVPYAARHSEAIFTVSENAKADIASTYKIDPDRIVVTYNAVSDTFRKLTDDELDERELRQKFDIGDAPFILTVGNLQPRKNIPRLADAFLSLKKQGLAHKLVIVGKKAWMYDEILSAVKQHAQDIVLTDYVDERDLIRLYNAADAFVYPSFFEGFGLPPLEAMACGTPVAVSDATSLPEVVGDAGVYFDPFDVDSIAAAIRKLCTDESLRATLVDRSHEQIKKFSWKATSRAIIDTYRRVLGRIG